MKISTSWIEKIRYGMFSIEVPAMILLLSCLHYHKIINDARLKGMFKSLREGTLLGKKNTYHCLINNQWYNDESILEILQDTYVGELEIPIDIFIKQYQLYFY